MKTIEDILLGRRSVRRYERRAIEPEKLGFIYEALRAAPTSYNGQQFSVVAVTDQDVKEQLYGIIGQKQVKTCAAFLVFCLDFHQLELAAKSESAEFPEFQNTINGYTVGVVDAALAMHCAEVAAESLGLGCCCIGYARTADPEKTSRILGLPDKTAIVCGLAIGYPAEDPDVKPKRPLRVVVHDNRYGDDGMITEELAAYNKDIIEYNRERSGEKTANDWTSHILDYHAGECGRDIGGYLDAQDIKAGR